MQSVCLEPLREDCLLVCFGQKARAEAGAEREDIVHLVLEGLLVLFRPEIDRARRGGQCLIWAFQKPLRVSYDVRFEHSSCRKLMNSFLRPILWLLVDAHR